MIYLIGSLRNAKIPELGDWLRKEGFDVFDDWFSPGPEADDYWRLYEQARGRTYLEALKGWAGTHVYEFDKHHLDRADVVVLALPAGKSGHLELGYALGKGKPGYILLEEAEPERWDVMYQFATGVFGTKEDLVSAMQNHTKQARTDKLVQQLNCEHMWMCVPGDKCVLCGKVGL